MRKSYSIRKDITSFHYLYVHRPITKTIYMSLRPSGWYQILVWPMDYRACLIFKGGGGGVLVEKLFCSFFNPVILLYIYYDQCDKYGGKKKFPQLVSMEMAAIFDFRALTKVHITSKSLLQMQ